MNLQNVFSPENNKKTFPTTIVLFQTCFPHLSTTSTMKNLLTCSKEQKRYQRNTKKWHHDRKITESRCKD